MLRIVIDTASDITKKEADAMQVELVALKVLFGDENCPCETEEDREIFFQKLLHAKELPSTSQPSPSQYLEIYEQAESAGDEVLVLTLSAGLSGTYQSACIAKDMIAYEPITIVDTKNVIAAERLLIEYAVRLRAQGMGREDIEKKLIAVRDRVVLCGVVDTLTYLRKGGRIPASLAVVGEALKLKPALAVRDGVIEQLAKSRGMKQAVKRLYEEYDAMPVDPEFPVYFGYVHDPEPAEAFMTETVEKYNQTDVKLFPVGPTIAVHTGPGCIILVFVREE